MAPPSATITAINPATGQQGDILDGAQISGQFTHFSGASQVTFSGSGVTANSVNSNSANSLQCQVVIDPAATAGPFDVTVTTGDETAVGSGLFTVESALPVDLPPITAQAARALREAVNTYLRQNLVTGAAQEICEQFISVINDQLRTAAGTVK